MPSSVNHGIIDLSLFLHRSRGDRLDYRILGPPEVWADGQRVRLRGRRQDRLLAALLVDAGRVVTRDRLIEMVWDHDPPATADRQVQNLVAMLRRILIASGAANDVITTERAGYAIRVAAHRLDAARFVSLVDRARLLQASDDAAAATAYRSALAQWRGPALSGIGGRALESAAASWDERRTGAQEECLTCELECGRHMETVAELRALVAQHPFRERLTWLLMLALYRCGRQADALEAYREARRRLSEELGLDPGGDLRDLNGAILRRDPALDRMHRRSPPKTTISTATATATSLATPHTNEDRPSQLPADIADFSGRAAPLRSLERLLLDQVVTQPTAVVISTVTGGAGVGKTTLALHVAHRILQHFPDGQLYVDLQGAGAEPASPNTVLGRFLRALGIPADALPASIEERADLYRMRLAGRRVLVVLDNAADEAQVAPLLPGSAGCKVVITSRTRLTGLAGARLVALDVMAPVEAVVLLGQMIGTDRVAAEPAAAAELARLCGRLPLALRIVGARLAARPHWRLEQMVNRLADAHRRLDELRHGQLEVRASLDLSYHALDTAAQTMFRRLGLLDAPDVAAWVGASVLDMPADEAGEILDRLVDAQLIQPRVVASGEVRYRFHDLVRLYARERAHAEDAVESRDAALARAFGMWLCLAEMADARLGNPWLEPVHGSTPRPQADPSTVARLLDDPLVWLDTERAALVAAVIQSAAFDLSAFSWELTSALTGYLSTGLHIDDWTVCTRHALAAARAAGDRRGEGAVLLSVGDLHGFHGQFDEACACWHAALAIFERLGDDLGQAMCHAGLALDVAYLGDDRQGRNHAERALAILGPTGHPRARACALRILGLCLLRQRHTESARRCFQRALELHHMLGSQRGESEMRFRLGAVLVEEARYVEATSMLRDALAIMEMTGDHMHLATARLRLGEALIHLGRAAETVHLLEPYAGPSRHTRGIRGWALRVLGQAKLAEGRLDDALAYLREASAMFSELRVPAEEARTRQLLAIVTDGLEVG